MNYVLYLAVFAGVFMSTAAQSSLQAQSLTARQIVEKSDQTLRSSTNRSIIKMTIVRPDWSREMTMKSWSKGEDLGLILMVSPARDKGVAYLKMGKEIWNWQPVIEQTIKLPPAMMSQSWNGSDFTNDDLVQESSNVNDYTHTLAGEEVIDGQTCYQIEMIPHDDAAVVWSKVIMWIDKVHFLALKVDSYDEDDYLVNTLKASNIEAMGGRQLATYMEMIPADEPGNKTIVEYLSVEFDVNISDSFFSIQNMKNLE